MADSSNAVVPEEPPFCEILTERLRLRTLRLSDAETLMPLLTRMDVMRWTSRGPVSSVDEAERWVSERSMGKDVFNFAIELRDRDANTLPVIGLIGCWHPPEIGYLMHPDYAGKGYTTEAVKALVPALFDHIPAATSEGVGFDYVEGWVDVENGASLAIMRKCGFEYCETVPDPDNTLRGPSELLILRRPRPGKTLEELGVLSGKKDESPAPQPPIG